jgi:uracil-DNA glycosylase
MDPLENRLLELHQEIIACILCPRLVEHREAIACTRRAAYRDWDYWGKPLPGFGDPAARLLIVGLAPAAHGGNRTGRMFTGDRSGTFLAQALHEAGFASQPTSISRDDGLSLIDAYMVAILRCAPPDNKPLPAEIINCRNFLIRETALLERVQAVLALGKIALDEYLHAMQAAGRRTGHRTGRLPFAHGAEYELPGLPRLFVSYHPSQQNTQTGRLTAGMFNNVLHSIRRFLGT